MKKIIALTLVVCSFLIFSQISHASRSAQIDSDSSNTSQGFSFDPDDEASDEESYDKTAGFFGGTAAGCAQLCGNRIPIWKPGGKCDCGGNKLSNAASDTENQCTDDDGASVPCG